MQTGVKLSLLGGKAAARNPYTMLKGGVEKVGPFEWDATCSICGCTVDAPARNILEAHIGLRAEGWRLGRKIVKCAECCS